MVPLQLLVASALAWGGEPNSKVIEFTMEQRCRPCQTMSPIVSKLQRQGFPIEKVDIDQDKKTPAQYGVNRFPTFVLVVDGHEVDRKEGVMSEESLKAMCARIPAPAQDRAPKQRPTAVAVANGVDLGQPAALPKNAPVQKEKEPEKPGALARLFGKKKETPPTAPAEVRAQGADAMAIAASRRPVTPLAATVRLRVVDAKGDDLGTGTIIDSRPGQTLILTCGHIFRQWAKGSQVYVALFDGEQTTEIVGKLEAYELDEKRGLDLGLVSISTDHPLPACRVAASGKGVLVGAPVSSVGCGGGEPPTVQQQKITAINRYKTNDLECSAMPEPGRSGGGLFSRSGQVIGVCMLADPKYREGLYANLKAIHKFLDGQKLMRVYRDESAAEEEPQLAAAAPSDLEETPAETPAAESGEPSRERSRRPAKQSIAMAPSEVNQDLPVADNVSEDDVVGSEVVIIIRGNGKPGSPSKVVRLHRASRGFWEDLLPELDPRESLQETTLKSAPRELAPRTERRQARRPATGDPRMAADRSSSSETHEPQPYRRQRSARSEELSQATR